MDNSMLDKIDQKKIPKHVAIIMDGNGRWAKSRNLLRTAGHKKGIDAVEEVLEAGSILGIEAITVYAFSTENWKRPEDEVSYIFKLPQLFFNRLMSKLKKWNVKIKWIGELEHLPLSMRKLIDTFELETANNTGLLMFLAFNYGSRAEITTTTQKIAQAVQQQQLTVADITEDYISNMLYTESYSDVDLLIRTSGELRLSNYLLWQCAYSELYFTDVLWPDFTKERFYQAIYEYQQRNIRKGAVI